MFVLTPDTVLNARALETRHVPRRFIGRATLWPRRGGSAGLVARILWQVEIFRYLIVLAPFVVAALVWRDYAIVIAQAPLLMFLAIHFAETRLFGLTAAARRALMSEAEADSALDLLQARGRAILTRIAAARPPSDDRLYLVVEQAEMARIAPLTLVSVQSEREMALLRLPAGAEEHLRETLFAPPLDERVLQRLNLRDREFLRWVAFDTRAVSAHARLAALRISAPAR
jgi:hypothetical protein